MNRGFTILEMILVLTVISVIVLITIPNIARKREIIDDVGCKALIEVVNGQILTYKLEYGDDCDIADLVSEGLITEQQTTCPDGRQIEIIDGQAYAE